MCTPPKIVMYLQEEDTAGEVLVAYCEQSCVSEYQLYFLGTLYTIHALVLLFGTFLAYETRNVSQLL